MNVDALYCSGRYRVRTFTVEMRMSHWLDAPSVTRATDGGVVLELSEDIWDLQDVQEEGEILLLVLRKYPGRTNGVQVRVLSPSPAFSLNGKVVTGPELTVMLAEFE